MDLVLERILRVLTSYILCSYIVRKDLRYTNKCSYMIVLPRAEDGRSWVSRLCSQPPVDSYREPLFLPPQSWKDEGAMGGATFPLGTLIPLEPVEAAASASHDMALPTLVDELPKSFRTLLTPVPAPARSPSGVLALVVLHQIRPLLFHQIFTLPDSHRPSSGITVHDGGGALEQVFLVPLLTSACLPTLAAHVTELCTTATSWAGREI